MLLLRISLQHLILSRPSLEKGLCILLVVENLQNGTPKNFFACMGKCWKNGTRRMRRLWNPPMRRRIHAHGKPARKRSGWNARETAYCFSMARLKRSRRLSVKNYGTKPSSLLVKRVAPRLRVRADLLNVRAVRRGGPARSAQRKS